MDARTRLDRQRIAYSPDYFGQAHSLIPEIPLETTIPLTTQLQKPVDSLPLFPTQDPYLLDPSQTLIHPSFLDLDTKDIRTTSFEHEASLLAWANALPPTSDPTARSTPDLLMGTPDSTLDAIDLDEPPFLSLTHQDSSISNSTTGTNPFPLPPTSEADDSDEVSSMSSNPNATSHKHTRLPKRNIQCFLHGCNGRSFSTLGNYRRHCKEKSEQYSRPTCPRCRQQFSRAAGRDIHFKKRRCKVIGVDVNGIPYRSPLDMAYRVLRPELEGM